MIDEPIDQGVTSAGEAAPQGDNAAPQSEVREDQTAPDESIPQGEDAAPVGEETTETTDRGTKPAKEPESRYYQQLKNENADMRRLLGDPKALKEYLREAEGTQAPQEGKEDEVGTLVEQATLPNGQVDAHKLTQLMDERTTRKIEQGMQYLSQNMSRAQQMGRAYDEEKLLIRSEHPELDPRQKDKYDPELETMVGERFLARGGLEGKVSLRQVVDETFGYLEKLKGKATQQAETEVVRKRVGAIPAQSVPAQAKDDESQMSPEAILAKRVREQVQRRS